MRTTVNIHDELLQQAKETAVRRHCSLGNVIEDALQQSLARKRVIRSDTPTHLITFRGRGLQPGVDLDSNVSVLDAMETQ